MPASSDDLVAARPHHRAKAAGRPGSVLVLELNGPAMQIPGTAEADTDLGMVAEVDQLVPGQLRAAAPASRTTCWLVFGGSAHLLIVEPTWRDSPAAAANSRPVRPID
ncbi:MAG TPA: hypothetical protein VFP89_06925 [Propionibacteriaceae bacterium]|nr:hypothetical protein [Propionibacteriaceae bacterium]